MAPGREKAGSIPSSKPRSDWGRPVNPLRAEFLYAWSPPFGVVGSVESFASSNFWHCAELERLFRQILPFLLGFPSWPPYRKSVRITINTLTML